MSETDIDAIYDRLRRMLSLTEEAQITLEVGAALSQRDWEFLDEMTARRDRRGTLACALTPKQEGYLESLDRRVRAEIDRRRASAAYHADLQRRLDCGRDGQPASPPTA